MSELVDHVLELLEPMGDVSARRMFGGHGFFRKGIMFALESDDVLYLKVDDLTRPEFDRRDLTPFEYARSGDSITLSYRMAPEEALDSSSGMCEWAEVAYQAALRTGTPNRVINRALASAGTAEASLPNRALSDTARLQAASVAGSGTGATGSTRRIDVLRTEVVTPAEVAARLARERRAKGKGSSRKVSTNGKAVNVAAINGDAVNGKARTGHAGPVNGKAAGAKAVNGKVASAKTVNGKAVSAKAVNGKSASAKTVNGKVASAKAMNGKAANGKAVNGRAGNDEAASSSCQPIVVKGKTRARPSSAAKSSRASSATSAANGIEKAGNSPRPNLSKTMSKRAAAILTRSMLGGAS